MAQVAMQEGQSKKTSMEGMREMPRHSTRGLDSTPLFELRLAGGNPSIPSLGPCFRAFLEASEPNHAGGPSL